MSSAKFRCGRIVSTPNALAKLTHDDIMRGLEQHQAGDWGDTSEDDQKKNELALENGFRLFSMYHTETGVKFWIITEANRSATTILLPEDY